MNTKPYNILILGASYASLLGIKLVMAGHKVTLVCLPNEVELINRDGIRVRLPTNFKAARFESDAHTAMLRVLQADVEAVRFDDNGKSIELPVKLKVHDSVFVPLAKWSMLMAGNYRCVTAQGMRCLAVRTTSSGWTAWCNPSPHKKACVTRPLTRWWLWWTRSWSATVKPNDPRLRSS